jgi:hypothetical protein
MKKRILQILSTSPMCLSSPNLLQLAEKMAENVLGVWVRSRMEQGLALRF